MKLSLSELFSAWATPNEEDREALVRPLVSEDIVYADAHAPMSFTGADAFLEFLKVFNENVPDAEVRVIGATEVHGFTRATVALSRARAPLATVQYFIEADEDGRVTRLVGFDGTEDTP
ncbi:MAG: hypothetical protein AAFM92_16175 [Pseudomonadota bacterium]